MENLDSPDHQQLIVMGASNVSLGFHNIVNCAAKGFAGPIHVCGVEGHGRSYGIRTNIGPRGLPSILDSELWNWLPKTEASEFRPKALITDIGNDLMYQIPTEQIAAWVRECLERLLNHNCEIVITMLPLKSVETLTKSRYYFFRSLLFPGNRYSFQQIHDLVNEMDAHLRLIVNEFSVKAVEPNGEWYGFDPIHIRRQDRSIAWFEYLSHFANWSPGARDDAAGNQTTRKLHRNQISSIRCLMLKPHERSLLGQTRTTDQPVWTRENVKVSLF